MMENEQSYFNSSSTGEFQQPTPTVAQIQQWLVDYLANHLQLSPDQIDITVPFERYGLDSETAIVISGDLQEWLKCELEPELLFDYPTIEVLAQYLAEQR